MVDGGRPAKVAIIGGGCGAITTAFELSQPWLRHRFDVTVYQLGWRLGGKGASGRGPAGRIEEHGLHLWLGFYDNAFRLLRECYAELAASPGTFDVADWRTAFTPESDISLFVPADEGENRIWSACFPTRDGLPGDPIDGAGFRSMSYYVGQLIGLARTLLLGVEVRRSGQAQSGSDFEAPKERPALLDLVQSALSGAAFTTATMISHGLNLLQASLTWVWSAPDSALSRLAEAIATGSRHWLEGLIARDHRLRPIREVIDLVLAIVVGTFRFGLLGHPRGLEAIDHYECRDWLRLNGASEASLQSSFVRGLYDLALAYEDGDPMRPGLAAGQALRGSLRMFFGYRGALFWRMRAGMGDIVFAPLYEVLRRRGVKFAFFHRLRNVGLSGSETLQPGESPHVAALTFEVQAQVEGGLEYKPLIEVAGRPCWPSAPDWSQLVGGEHMARSCRDFESHWDRGEDETKVLRVSTDFDFVVLGVSIGEVPQVCQEILAHDPRWRSMVEHVKSVATQSFQIWLDHSIEDLGWSHASLVGSAFHKPFDTWCDMAHSIPHEGWRIWPKTAVYFCGVLADPPQPPADDDRDYPQRRADEVRASAVAYLRHHVRHILPQSHDPAGEFRWDMLVDAHANAASAGSGAVRFTTQYWRANVNPTDRYVLALPDSLRHRISPLDNTYDNLTIAGDWTDCGFNEGCVEAAVMSGRLAAHALAGTPKLEDIVGYNHP